MPFTRTYGFANHNHKMDLTQVNAMGEYWITEN